MKARVDFEVPQGARESTCGSCGAAIAWIEVEARRDGSPRRMPVHLSTAQIGLDGVRRAESHFAHCPNAEQHRRNR